MHSLDLLLTITLLIPAALSAVIHDYVIVGGGATGLALAVRLSEDPSKSVVVLEAGRSGFGNPNITDMRLSRNNIGTTEDWQFITVPQVDTGGRVQAQVQGRVLGGGSAINSGQYTRGNKIEYDMLETLGAEGWNWKSLFSAVIKSEHFFAPTDTDINALNLTFNPSFHGTSGPIANSLQALNISRLFPEVVVPTLRSLGYEMNPDSNGGRHNGASWNYLTTLPDTSTRSYAVSGYYLPVINRTNLRVMVNSHVSKILWSSERKNDPLTATGIEYLALGSTQQPVHQASINARNIILSASTLNTPKILELSGVGDPKILNRFGIDVKIDLPGVGENLCNQPMSTASYLLKPGTVNVTTSIRSAILDFEPLDKFMNVQDVVRSNKLLSVKPQGLSKRQFGVMKRTIESTDVPQVEFAWNIASANNTTALVFDRIVLLKPLSRGSVHISSTNPLQHPVIDPKYLNAPWDKFVLAKAVQFTRTMVNTEPLKSLIEGPLKPDSNAKEELDFIHFVETESQSEHHFVGTAAMVPRSEGGVIDSSLLVYGTSNVRVADASIISNLPGIHTVSLAYAIAERAANIIRKDSR